MLAGPSDIAEDRILAALRALDRHFAPIADAAQEIAIMAYLDPEWRLLGMRHHAAGQTQSLSADPAPGAHARCGGGAAGRARRIRAGWHGTLP
jgi:hypothetical protein